MRDCIQQPWYRPCKIPLIDDGFLLVQYRLNLEQDLTPLLTTAPHLISLFSLSRR
jgi:hypothetical protein